MSGSAATSPFCVCTPRARGRVRGCDRGKWQAAVSGQLPRDRQTFALSPRDSIRCSIARGSVVHTTPCALAYRKLRVHPICPSSVASLPRLLTRAASRLRLLTMLTGETDGRPAFKVATSGNLFGLGPPGLRPKLRTLARPCPLSRQHPEDPGPAAHADFAGNRDRTEKPTNRARRAVGDQLPGLQSVRSLGTATAVNPSAAVSVPCTADRRWKPTVAARRTLRPRT
jgi:hypothetical protein